MSTEQEVPTLEQVEAWKARLKETEEALAEATARDREIVARLAALRADGDDASEEAEELRSQRSELRAEIEEIQATIPVLKERIKDGHEAAHRAKAAERLSAIKRTVGGLAGEQPRRAERLAEAVATVVEGVEGMNEAHLRFKHLEAEARALVERFGLPDPGLKTVFPPGHDDTVERALIKVQDTHASRDMRPVKRPARDSEAARILAAAGPSEEERKAAAEKERQERERLRKEEEQLAPFIPHLERAEAHLAARNFGRG